MNNLSKYEDIFIKYLRVEREQLAPLEYQSVSAWDSIGHMMLIAAIEETFSIEVVPDDIIDFSSFENGKKILKKYNITI